MNAFQTQQGPVTPRERNNQVGIRPVVHSVLAVLFQRNLALSNERDGVSTYLALTFGTLLSSQGTDASFVLTLSGFPPGFPSVLLSYVSDSIRTFRHLIPSQRVCLSGPSAVPTSETLAEPIPRR